jgi:hypothetical protein
VNQLFHEVLEDIDTPQDRMVLVKLDVPNLSFWPSQGNWEVEDVEEFLLVRTTDYILPQSVPARLSLAKDWIVNRL